MIQSPKVSPFAIALQQLAMISLCFEGSVSQGNPGSIKIQLSYTSPPIGMVPDLSWSTWWYFTLTAGLATPGPNFCWHIPPWLGCDNIPCARGGVKFLHIEKKITSVLHSHLPSHCIRRHWWCSLPKLSAFAFLAATLHCADVRQFHYIFSHEIVPGTPNKFMKHLNQPSHLLSSFWDVESHRVTNIDVTWFTIPKQKMTMPSRCFVIFLGRLLKAIQIYAGGAEPPHQRVHPLVVRIRSVFGLWRQKDHSHGATTDPTSGCSGMDHDDSYCRGRGRRWIFDQLPTMEFGYLFGCLVWLWCRDDGFYTEIGGEMSKFIYANFDLYMTCKEGCKTTFVSKGVVHDKGAKLHLFQMEWFMTRVHNHLFLENMSAIK